MSRHASDVAWAIMAGLAIQSTMTEEGTELGQGSRRGWAVSPPTLVRCDPSADFAERDGVWALIVDGDFRGFKVTVETLELDVALNAIFDEEARERLLAGPDA